MVRILACLVGVLAAGLVTAASASAVAGNAFDAPEYNPAVETKAHFTNGQGFEGGGLVIVCDPAKAPVTNDTNEEVGVLGPTKEATNNKENKKEIIVHPVYSGPAESEKCRGTIGAKSFPVEVRTQGINFKVLSTSPHKLPALGENEIVRAATKQLEPDSQNVHGVHGSGARRASA
jgi:hypothetical protein